MTFSPTTSRRRGSARGLRLAAGLVAAGAVLAVLAGSVRAAPDQAVPPPSPDVTPAPGTAPLVSPTPAPRATPAPPTVDPGRYERALTDLEAAVRARQLRKPALRKLAPPSGQLRRADGTAQGVDNRQLGRGLDKALKDGRLPRRHAETLSESLRARKAEAARWQRSRYAPAEATGIISQLAKSGQIRVGPTAYQLWMKSVRDWWGKLMSKIGQWIFGRTPNVRPAKLPQIDPRWVKFFFYSTVFSLLAIIAYMVWKALGGRIGRRDPRMEDRVLEGEDAELLKLPSDELLDRAARFAGQTNYREAVRHRFIATLVRFDERSLWRYNTRRTNREHIALLRDNAARTALAPPLESLARRFDRVRYGNAEASHADWVRFDSDATALESMDAARADFSSAGNAPRAKGARA